MITLTIKISRPKLRGYCGKRPGNWNKAYGRDLEVAR